MEQAEKYEIGHLYNLPFQEVLASCPWAAYIKIQVQQYKTDT